MLVLYFASFEYCNARFFRIGMRGFPFLACATLFLLFGLGLLLVFNALATIMTFVLHVLAFSHARTRFGAISTERLPPLACATLFFLFGLGHRCASRALRTLMIFVLYFPSLGHRLLSCFRIMTERIPPLAFGALLLQFRKLH